MSRAIEVRGQKVPTFLYGTAWKEERTEALVRLALSQGFTAIDTANQRRHYVEAAVGDAIAASGVDRATLFLQTKFTYARGQDHRLPYDPAGSFAEQVAQSLASSLEHLRTDVIDSYVLHGPSRGHGLGDADWEVWGAMETAHREGKVRLLGVSNVSLDQLVSLHGGATIKPAFVQNRCFARDGWDAKVREFCRDAEVIYQGFSLLTANGRELGAPAARDIARAHGRTLPQVVFRFALQLGMIPLTGTSDAEHMRQDLEVFDFELSASEMHTLENIGSA
jgi:diketogulonate reductase-like aldo/keto reductase